MLDDAWSAVAELAASQHGVFTRAQAAARGVDYRRLATGVRAARVVSVTPSVFAFAGRSRSPRQGLVSAILALPGAVASHHAAAQLGAFDGFEHLTSELTTTAGRRGVPPLGGVVVHRVARFPAKRDLIVVDGIRATGVARTLVDLGAVVDRDVVRRALIGLHAKGYSLNWFRTTALAVNTPGRNGPRVLLGLLDEYERAGTVPASWLEEVLRRILEHPDLPPLTSQHVLRDRAGTFVARFDHAFVDVKVAIEGHSRKFHFGPIAEAKDEDRDLQSARQGWEIVYLGWYASMRPERVVEAIVDVVAQRAPLVAA